MFVQKSRSDPPWSLDKCSLRKHLRVPHKGRYPKLPPRVQILQTIRYVSCFLKVSGITYLSRSLHTTHAHTDIEDTRCVFRLRVFPARYRPRLLTTTTRILKCAQRWPLGSSYPIQSVTAAPPHPPLHHPYGGPNRHCSIPNSHRHTPHGTRFPHHQNRRSRPQTPPKRSNPRLPHKGIEVPTKSMRNQSTPPTPLPTVVTNHSNEPCVPTPKMSLTPRAA